jgi:NADP-dependent 3-hydroxy acid dehydrogenase YdfG
MKTILITGATSGIGKSTAELLAKQGNRIIICGRRSKVLENVKNELSQYTEIFSLKFDVRNLEEVETAIGSLPSEWKNIDVLSLDTKHSIVCSRSTHIVHRIWNLFVV